MRYCTLLYMHQPPLVSRIHEVRFKFLSGFEESLEEGNGMLYDHSPTPPPLFPLFTLFLPLHSSVLSTFSLSLPVQLYFSLLLVGVGLCEGK